MIIPPTYHRGFVRARQTRYHPPPPPSMRACSLERQTPIIINGVKVPPGVDSAGDPPVLHRVGQRERAVLSLSPLRGLRPRQGNRRHAALRHQEGPLQGEAKEAGTRTGREGGGEGGKRRAGGRGGEGARCLPPTICGTTNIPSMDGR